VGRSPARTAGPARPWLRSAPAARAAGPGTVAEPATRPGTVAEPATRPGAVLARFALPGALAAALALAACGPLTSPASGANHGASASASAAAAGQAGRANPSGAAGSGAGGGGAAHPGSTPVNGHVTGTAPTGCQFRRAVNGQPLPDPACTPGVASSAVTQSNLDTTICRSGYASSVRAPEAETEAFKRKVIRAYAAPGPLSSYELDHLISLELGGSNDAGNLWPQLDDHPRNGVQNSKDLVENALHDAVCGHVVTLRAAQSAIATDWTTALARLGLPPVR
jgi:hypothetical protein